jgi:dihydrofolate synthase/folylpolyglutamate synthase
MIFFEELKEYKSMTIGLSRIKNFLDDIGNPQNNIKFVHIAGSNGKGSTATFISEILKNAGYKVALYTSPHLINITERIKINGQDISQNIFDYLSKKYLKKAIYFKLSFFEYLTVIAFIYFNEQKVDIAVIETGLGGRFDATNIIKNTLICVITSISNEHNDVLGDNLDKIFFEKTGIIKNNAFIVCGNLYNFDMTKIIQEKQNKLYLYNNDFIAINNKSSLYMQNFDYVSKNIKITNIEIKLFGRYQIINASIAVCVATLLNYKHFFLNEKHIKYGLKNTSIECRFDIKKIRSFNKNYDIIIDGSHNVEGIDMFVETFIELGFSCKKRTFIFSVMKEKRYKEMIKRIVLFANKVILPNIDNNRSLNQYVLKREFSEYIDERNIYVVNNVVDACNMINENEVAISIGSLYLAGKILNILKNCI